MQALARLRRRRPRLSRRRLVRTSAASLLALGGSSLWFPRPAWGAQQGEGEFAGTWRVTTTSEDRPPERLVVVMASDGTFASASLATQPAQAGALTPTVYNSIGLGVWVAPEPNVSVATFEVRQSDAGGALVALVTIRGRHELSSDGERFTGRFTATVAGPGGDILRTMSGRIEGTRMHAEAPV